MSISEQFWESSLEELKKGYKEEPTYYICLLCSKAVEKGVIYPHQSVLYEAERYMRAHIEESHGSVFDYLIGLDKKLTGLTDHQNRLLRLFYEGKSDQEVQKETGIGSASTIRHHRFALKEKERQAKLLLTMMELLKERDEHAPAFVPVHQQAKMIDERYNFTVEEKEKVVAKYLPDGLEGKLNKFPLKEKQRLILLTEISKIFDSNKVYTEKEVKQGLKRLYEDDVLLRRYLIEYGFLDREADGSKYWVKK
ncbi:DUF2087 domain-containing protein [Priestia koreensis]|uniref:DUF2087 domain-containing protein n=1 Tax=Priestia koreensis TaxID=284581 RepID=UPI00345AED62